MRRKNTVVVECAFFAKIQDRPFGTAQQLCRLIRVHVDEDDPRDAIGVQLSDEDTDGFLIQRDGRGRQCLAAVDQAALDPFHLKRTDASTPLSSAGLPRYTWPFRASRVSTAPAARAASLVITMRSITVELRPRKARSPTRLKPPTVAEDAR